MKSISAARGSAGRCGTLGYAFTGLTPRELRFRASVDAENFGSVSERIAGRPIAQEYGIRCRGHFLRTRRYIHTVFSEVSRTGQQTFIFKFKPTSPRCAASTTASVTSRLRE